MTHDDKILLSIIAGTVVGAAILATLVVGQSNDVLKAEAVRQVRINTFYNDHNCRPLGYVATKYDPIRTYQCDNGVFIPRDMAGAE